MTNVPAGAAIPRDIHPDALALVRHFEGLYLSAYLCPAGVPTIGYGHTAGVRMGQTIDGLQAEVFLRADMADAARDVDRLVKVLLTDQQRGALASFVFNLGAGALQSSTLLRLLNQGDYAGAAKEFPKWVYATVDGIKTQLPGLVKRRAAEAKLFEAG
ncbi:lysozyme [Azospirillum himalayense]|uniref:Lysozyme n=1 Tax=Azospirillum himalayense TaxID=654847 RepID=A0ABW0GB59_9PROT